MGGGADDGETVVATRTGFECEGCSEARAHVYEWRRSVVWTRAVSLSRGVLRPEVHYGKRRIRAPVSVLTPLSKDSVHHSTRRERERDSLFLFCLSLCHTRVIRMIRIGTHIELS